MKLPNKISYILLYALSAVALIGLTFSLIGGFYQTPSAAADTSTFQAGHIIDDNVFTDSNSLSAAQIQQFLQDKEYPCYSVGSKSTNPENGACLYEYIENTSTLQNNFSNPTETINGGISAAQIIYNTAQEYDINPEVILTVLQKEQGLITDNWPWYSEYQYAMGYACPDSSGCSVNYADFYEQVSGAAWQFRDYLNNPGEFNYWIGNNTINYAPSCSGSTVNIQNAATAALYIYTPYQPDSNVLVNTNPIGSSSGPGPSISTTDSCAAYGNRNFWWYFNTWFGPSVDTNVSLGEETGTSTIYVLYDGQKQGIPSTDVLDAWGLNGIPVTSLDSAVFNAIPTATTALTRYAINTTTGQNLFADNGNVYYVSANDALTWGNFPGQSLSQVSSTLENFANYQGEIEPFISISGNPTYYVVDNGKLHAVTSGLVYALWAGDNTSPIQLSSSYFNTMSQGSNISSPEYSYNGSDYILSDGEEFLLANNIQNLLPNGWTITSISQGLNNSFLNGGIMSYMLKANNSSTVYLLNSGTLEGIPNPQIATEFQNNGSGTISIVSSDLINAIPSGAVVGSNIINIGGNSYVVNQGLHPIPSNLLSAYNTNITGISLNSSYQTFFSTINNATAFVGSNDSPTIYFLDTGSKLPFSNPNTLSLVSGNTPITYLSDVTLTLFTSGNVMQNYITDLSTSYLLDGGNAYSIPSADVANAWGLINPVTISVAASSDFNLIGALSQHVQIPNGQFCFIDNITRYCAGSNTMISLWNLTANVVDPSSLLLQSLYIQNGPALSDFVIGMPGQPSGRTLYTVDNGQFLGIPTIYDALNFGYNGQATVLSQKSINDFISSSTITQGYLAYDNSGNLWILDGGVKHSISSSLVSEWVGSQIPITLGTTYLSQLTTGATISNSIKSSTNPTVYAVINSELYAFSSQQLYITSGLLNYSIISSSLVNSMPIAGFWTQ